MSSARVDRIPPPEAVRGKTKRRGIGIVLPVPCRFAVIGLRVFRPAGHRVQGPGAAAGLVQLPPLFLRELLIGNEFFHWLLLSFFFGGSQVFLRSPDDNYQPSASFLYLLYFSALKAFAFSSRASASAGKVRRREA